MDFYHIQMSIVIHSYHFWEMLKNIFKLKKQQNFQHNYKASSALRSIQEEETKSLGC